MTISLKQLLLVLGGLLFGIGLIFGLMPVKANGVSCGTALTGQSDQAFVSDLTNTMTGFGSTDTDSACEDGISGRRTITFALGIPGLLLLLGSMASQANSSLSKWDERNPSYPAHGGP